MFLKCDTDVCTKLFKFFKKYENFVSGFAHP